MTNGDTAENNSYNYYSMVHTTYLHCEDVQARRALVPLPDPGYHRDVVRYPLGVYLASKT
jgi:hypothetical protein